MPRKAKKKDAGPPQPPGAPPAPDPRRQVQSWATWQREIALLLYLAIANIVCSGSQSGADTPVARADAAGAGQYQPWIVRSPLASRLAALLMKSLLLRSY
jgi:hypothetical protein